MPITQPLSRRDACRVFARGGNPSTSCALTFRDDVAYSYEEPIAMRSADGKTLRVTNVGRAKGSESLTSVFSATTAHHVGYVAGAWAVENVVETLEFVEHGELRHFVRCAGQSVGDAGARFDD